MSRAILLFVCGLFLSFCGLGCGGGDEDGPTGTGPCGITVQTPEADSEYCTGNVMNVWWQRENTSGRVNIDLYKDGSQVGRMRENTLDLGAADITTSIYGAAPGDGFQVVVSDASNPDCSSTTSEFSIYDPLQCSFDITQPVPGRYFTRGTTQTLLWTSAGSSDYVDVDLYHSGNMFVKRVATRTPNDGEMDWEITSHHCANVYYHLQVNDSVAHNQTDACFGRSHTFRVNYPAGESYDCGMSILAPAPEVTWIRGDEETITFTASNIVGDSVNLLLRRNGNTVAVLNEQEGPIEVGPGINFFLWNVSTYEITDMNLTYTILMEDSGSSCCLLETMLFTITGPVPGDVAR